MEKICIFSMLKIYHILHKKNIHPFRAENLPYPAWKKYASFPC